MSDQYDIVYSLYRPGEWPPLHAAKVVDIGETQKTVCGITLTPNWDGDADFSIQDVECKRCRAGLRKLGET